MIHLHNETVMFKICTHMIIFTLKKRKNKNNPFSEVPILTVCEFFGFNVNSVSAAGNFTMYGTLCEPAVLFIWKSYANLAATVWFPVF